MQVPSLQYPLQIVFAHNDPQPLTELEQDISVPLVALTVGQ